MSNIYIIPLPFIKDKRGVILVQVFPARRRPERSVALSVVEVSKEKYRPQWFKMDAKFLSLA